MTARKPKSEHKPDGRPRQYEERFNKMAFVACSEGGFIDKSLGKLFGVSDRTINRWKKDYPEFCQSIKSGKDIANCNTAENSMFKIVNGFSYNETFKKSVTVKDKEGNPIINNKTGCVKTKMVTVKTIRKTVAPNQKAGEFWLRNRDPERWPNKQTIDHGITKDLADHATKIAEARARKKK